MTESGFRVFLTGSSGKLKPKLNLTGINTHLTGNLKNKTKQNSMNGTGSRIWDNLYWL